MAKTFDQALAESGQQSTLDQLRSSGGYEDALKAYNESGQLPGGGQAASTGGPDISGVPSVTEFVQKQGQQEDAALRDLTLQMRSQDKPIDIFTGLEEKAGIPQLRASAGTITKEIQSIEDQLEQVEPSVAGRSRESLLTEAQRQRAVQVEKEPLQESLTKLGTSLGRISGAIQSGLQDIATKTGLVLQGQDMELEPARLKYTALVDRNARLTSAFTADRQTQLDSIFSKWERQNYLDDREWELAADLAAQEDAYLNQLKATAADAGVEITGNESTNELLAKISRSAAADKAASASTFDFGSLFGAQEDSNYIVEPISFDMESQFNDLFGINNDISLEGLEL